MTLFTQIKNKNIHYRRDMAAGVVVALVSIPISMGYAQIAGLPPLYGLYGSLLPILCFGLLTTSPQFVVGVDAMPAVMVGTLAANMGIAAESKEALMLAPLMALFVAGWFVLFCFLKAGSVVKYISTPVMGGFISGVGMTILLMQVPKLFGKSAGTGEVVSLLLHIGRESEEFHLLSFLLGFGTIVIILVCKKLIPKVPMTAVMLLVGAVLQMIFSFDRYGVKLLPDVKSGLPSFVLPDITLFWDHIDDIVIQSASIALVVMAQTLLASGRYAMQYQDVLDNNRELLAYAAMNFASGLFGTCPINGSVSRSGIADSLGCRSQIMSVTASATMLLVLLFGTPLLRFLPVPILTGIVMTALIGILDIRLMKRLWKSNKNEWLIFMAAFAGVLIFGTVNGVLIGTLLAFGEVAVRSVNPTSSFLGRMPGHGNFYSLARNSAARPIFGAVIYRFNGNLFFANVDRFQKDIEQAIDADTRIVVVDARGIGSVDITAVDRLVMMRKIFEERGIRFYITEHDGGLNDVIRKLGGGELMEKDAVRRTITLALRDGGMEKPYTIVTENGNRKENEDDSRYVEDEARFSEFEWLFGTENAGKKIRQMANAAAEKLAAAGEKAAELESGLLDGDGVKTDWGMIGLSDENSFLDFFEVRMAELYEQGKISKELAEDAKMHAENRRKCGEDRLNRLRSRANRKGR